MNTAAGFHLNWFDFTILGIICLSIIISLFRGFLREAISLFTWLMAFILALRYAPEFSQFLHPVVSNPTVSYSIALVLIFIIVLVLGAMLNSLAHRLVTTSGFGLLDRFIGLFFGAGRGVLFVVIILLIVQASPYDKATWLKQSELAPYFSGLVKKMSEVVPDHMRAASSWLEHLTNKKSA